MANGCGRPTKDDARFLERHNVMLTEEQYLILRKYGNCNFSLGVRMAARMIKDMDSGKA